MTPSTEQSHDLIALRNTAKTPLSFLRTENCPDSVEAPSCLHAFTSFLCSLLLSCLLTGCGGGGKLRIQNESDPGTRLHGEFASGIYRLDDSGQFTALLTTGSPQNPTRALVIRLLWMPKSGRTPLDPDATNASIRYVVFHDDQVAIYHGGGFVQPHQVPGPMLLTAAIEQANLHLLDATSGFDDKIHHAQAEGTITLHRDDQAIQPALRILSLQVAKHLGRPQFVWGTQEH